MRNYPPDWPCKCGHLEKDHGIAVNAHFQSACLIEKVQEDGVKDFEYFDNCGSFRPVDNLTRIAQLAEEKRLV